MKLRDERLNHEGAKSAKESGERRIESFSPSSLLHALRAFVVHAFSGR